MRSASEHDPEVQNEIYIEHHLCGEQGDRNAENDPVDSPCRRIPGFLRLMDQRSGADERDQPSSRKQQDIRFLHSLFGDLSVRTAGGGFRYSTTQENPNNCYTDQKRPN